MGFVIMIGVLIMWLGFGNAAARWASDQNHPEQRGQAIVVRKGFVHLPIRPALYLGLVGVVVLVVGIVGYCV